jgi:hypothetical protein
MEDPDFDAEYLKLQSRHQRYRRLAKRQVWYGFIALVAAFAPLGVVVLAVKGLSVAYPAADPAWLLVLVAIPIAAAVWAFGKWRRRNHA